MVFSSITFLYAFLPCVFLLYFAVPIKLKNFVLLCASLFFYAWGEPVYVWIMLAETGIVWLLGIKIGKYGKGAPGKFCLGASLILQFGLLFFFKYTDFFLLNFEKVTNVSAKTLSIALPIGISFYTFQLAGYVIDVYEGRILPQKNFLTLAAYVTMFPQLIAGPIIRYADVEKQLTDRKSSYAEIVSGIRRFLVGLGKKVLLANTLGELCNIFRDSSQQSVAFYWLYAAAFTLLIYFDFSGYSDMAIGLGKIFGFHFPENFRYPYISGSITEFWRRWHISLGNWFRDYVYIPLGGNRVSKLKWIRNIWIVWLFTGFWHGAAWNFIVWGGLFAVFLLLEKGNFGRWVQKKSLLRHFYVMFVIMIGFVIFHADGITQAVQDLGCMFGFGQLPLVSLETLYYLKSYGITLGLAVLGATPLPVSVWNQIKEKTGGAGICNLAESVCSFLLLIVITAYLVDGSFQPFLYFRF